MVTLFQIKAPKEKGRMIKIIYRMIRWWFYDLHVLLKDKISKTHYLGQQELTLIGLSVQIFVIMTRILIKDQREQTGQRTKDLT